MTRLSRKYHLAYLSFFLLGALALLVALDSNACAESFTGELGLIKRLSPEEKLTFFGLQYMMNQYQKKQFLNLPTKQERAEWIERFWIDLDPTPTTEINERRIEHDKRVSLARKLFGMKKAPGWDKRGETVIRFGLPSYRAKTWANVGFYRMTPPGETWYYEALDMLISFHNFNLKGEFIYAIEPYGRTPREDQERLKNVWDLFKYDVMQEVHPTEYLDIEEIKDIMDFNPDEIDYIADPDIRMYTPKDLIAQFEQEKIEKSANNFYKYMKEKPTIYSFELNQDLLPFYFDITSFKGGPGALRTDVNFEVPAGEVRFIRREGKLNAEIEIRALIRDTQMNKVAEAVDVIQAIQAGEGVFAGPSHLPGQITLTLKPGYYHVGLETVDRHSGRRGMLKTNLELAPIGSELALSDIQFASSIQETEENQKFVKGNLQVIPHPLHAYRIPYPLSIYFEIYGLDTDREGISFYTVEYKIVPLQKRRKGPVLEEMSSIISSKFETTGYGSMQVQRLSITTTNLWEGPFRLIVTVTDRRTLVSTEKSSNFSILD